jgi:hypothetical protein
MLYTYLAQNLESPEHISGVGRRRSTMERPQRSRRVAAAAVCSAALCIAAACIAGGSPAGRGGAGLIETESEEVLTHDIFSPAKVRTGQLDKRARVRANARRLMCPAQPRRHALCWPD